MGKGKLANSKKQFFIPYHLRPIANAGDMGRGCIYKYPLKIVGIYTKQKYGKRNVAKRV